MCGVRRLLPAPGFDFALSGGHTASVAIAPAGQPHVSCSERRNRSSEMIAPNYSMASPCRIKFFSPIFTRDHRLGIPFFRS